MRFLIGAVAYLACAAAALALDIHEPTFKGWGGEGGQVFRSKISVCRNRETAERQLLVIVDDLPRRGPRIGIQRFTVEYTGGEGSERIVQAIHKKPYEYVLVKMYQTPQSPGMARVVLPQPRGVKATFRFYKFRHRNRETGEIDSGLVKELTRTFDCADLEQLTYVNPMRDPSIRRPRGNPNAVLAAPPEEAPASDVAAVVPAPPPSDAPMSDATPLSAADPRLEMTRKWAAEAKNELSGEPAPRPQESSPEIGIADIPGDAPSMKMQYDEDTPEMKAAEARANRLAERIRAEQAFQ